MRKSMRIPTTSSSPSCGAEKWLKVVICIYIILQGGCAVCSRLILSYWGVDEILEKQAGFDHIESFIFTAFITFFWFLIGFVWGILLLRRLAVPVDTRYSDYLVSTIHTEFVLVPFDQIGLSGLLLGRLVTVALTSLASSVLMFANNDFLQIPCLIILFTTLVIDLPVWIIIKVLCSVLLRKVVTVSVINCEYYDSD